ncbi:MAG: HAMP domain-containing protein [Myxococcales bacterium]|nr:HAMP domain-containing protein [Myxococcales bacterium]
MGRPETPAAEPAEATTRVAPVPFKRRFFAPAVILLAAELLVVGLPLWRLFDLASIPRAILLRTALPVSITAVLLWSIAVVAWLLPLRAVVVARRQGARPDASKAARAERFTQHAAVRALILRTLLWAGAAVITGLFFMRYVQWRTHQVAEFTAVAALHAYAVSCVRALWWNSILGGVRESLFRHSAQQQRQDEVFRQLLLVTMVVAGGVLAAQAAFTYYFVPVSFEQYLQLQTYVPAAAALGLLAWSFLARWLTSGLRQYLASARGEVPGGSAVPAAIVYRRAQEIPYRLALLTFGMWLTIAAIGFATATLHLGIEVDDALVLVIATVVLALTGIIYEALGHRDALGPLLAHIMQRHRVPIRTVTPTLSLRSKLLLSFGGMALLACGMAMLWGFVQYKTLATDAALRQADIGLQWVRSEVQAAIAAESRPPTAELVRATLRRLGAGAPDASAVLYYLDPQGDPNRDHELMAVGGGPMGAPKLPWYARARLEYPRRGALNVVAAQLTGRATRLHLAWNGTTYALGGVAVFYPSYRGRGESMVRPLRELLVFFLVLFSVCGGIVGFTVAQFASPIRQLEKRAEGMARGELAEPVSAGTEGDEIGRLTYALEEMRRALRDKLRSTEEVNLDLERAVQNRTADLAKKNRELAETLDKLTQAQAQLVRSEKLASIGQLVAGIAHEINNPVNAIVNTVGPLEEAITEIDTADEAARSEAARDIRDMVRVVQRGAQRTKAIVQALHNYSRTDDESVVEFDIDRTIDDSLELLRHLLKQHVTVEKHYGEAGRVSGHAGQIGQVFMNLLTNAAQAVAGRDAAVIRIESRGDADRVAITIADNGPGIPTHVLPRIWDPFFTTKDVGEGTGLGLSIVHELVERHGGTITVDTELGKGTSFTVTLPRRTLERRVVRPRTA